MVLKKRKAGACSSCGRIVPVFVVNVILMAVPYFLLSLPLSSQSSRTKVSESSMQSQNTLGNLLSELYRSTNNDGELIPFVRRQLNRTNPALSKLPHVKFGTPSLARDETTGRVVIAFRIETPTIVDAKGESMSGLMNANFLLLCELIWPIESVECQDSGLFPWTIPPQCSSYPIDPDLHIAL